MTPNKGKNINFSRSQLRIGIGIISLAFAVLVGLIFPTGFIQSTDHKTWIKAIEFRQESITRFMVLLATIFSSVGCLILAAFSTTAIWFWKRNWRYPFFLATTVLSATIITHFFKLIFHRSRPPAQLRLMTETTFSYPSGHATGTLALALGIALVFKMMTIPKRWQSLTWLSGIMVTLCVCVSRIYLGVHWFTDLLGGLAVATGCALISYSLFFPNEK